jgi:hypothetical protein
MGQKPRFGGRLSYVCYTPENRRGNGLGAVRLGAIICRQPE